MANKPTYISVSDNDFETIINNFKTGKIESKYQNRFIGTPPAISITLENLIPRYFTFFGVLEKATEQDDGNLNGPYNEAIKKDFFAKIKAQGFRFKKEGFFPESGAAANFGGKFASIEQTYGPTDKNDALLYQIFVSSPTLLSKNQIVSEKSVAEKPKKETSNFSKISLIPGDIAIEDGDVKFAVY
jgi:hypothetical protein